MAAIQRVVLGCARIHAEQIHQGRRGKPMPVQPPFRARGEQSVDHEDAQNLFPVSALSADGQPGTEKIVQVQCAPQMVGKPARAPLPRIFQPQFIESDLHALGVGRRRRTVRREQRELPMLAGLLVKHRQRALPRALLAIV